MIDSDKITKKKKIVEDKAPAMHIDIKKFDIRQEMTNWQIDLNIALRKLSNFESFACILNL